MTHFSAADAPDVRVMNQQIDCFNACHSVNSMAGASLANSAAILRRPDIHADWVRPGILLYGCNPVPDCQIEVRPAVTLAARVIAVREIHRGESVGYSGTWTAKRSSRIATVGIGYGDGYPRHARPGTPVLINGQTAALVGRVSMDSLAADVTRIGDVQVGDEVVLWGSELTPATIAECAGTISNALLTSITSRVVRRHS
jgi:alanine racemase